jgi:hypothetical protein
MLVSEFVIRFARVSKRIEVLRTENLVMIKSPIESSHYVLKHLRYLRRNLVRAIDHLQELTDLDTLDLRSVRIICQRINKTTNRDVIHVCVRTLANLN